MSIQVKEEIDEFLVERNQPSLRQRLDLIVNIAHNLAVTNEENFRRITSMYAEAKDWEKKIDFIRKQANMPDQERINVRNDKAKELLTLLKQIQDIAKQKSAGYQAMLEDLKAKEQEKMQKAVEILGLEESPYFAPVEKSQHGDGAIAYTRIVRKFRITDISKVPDKYFIINEDLIEQDIKLGLNEIPGIEIYEEKVTQLKTR